MKKPQRQTLTAPIRRVRFVYVAMFLCAWVGVIAVRLAWLQIVRHDEFAERAKQQQQRMFEVAPRRGVLYDRNMREMAMTIQVESVYAVPSEVGDSKASDALLLARIVHVDPEDSFTSEPQIEARLNASHNFAWIARKLDPDTASRVRELNLKGIYMQKEFKRYYPDSDLASPVLGYVGTDDDGLSGFERKFDSKLHGEPGHVLTAIDAKRHVLDSEESDPLPGQSMELTIDSNIQYMAERALDEQMAKVKALHGTVVVQDPRTGQILALAVSPRFNPNNSKHIDPDSLADLAVSDAYEPGSTFKLVTYSAAIDAAGVQPTDIIDCQGGAITLYGRTIHDDKSDVGMGKVTIQRALEKSSDVAAVKLALKLGPEKFYSYMKGYGFGARTGIELPSETRGLLRSPQRWSATSIGSLAIGQEVGVTPVQLVSMVSTIANGGVYMPPHVLLQTDDETKGTSNLRAEPFHPVSQLPVKLPDGAHRVISEMTAAKMRAMMQGIVVEGTGQAAQLNGYSSAGKTGTAQKFDPETKAYSHTKLVASFAGFAPVSAPAISVTVVIDTPTVGSLYGSSVSAPVFREVAQQVLEYLGVPHDQPVQSQRQMQLARNSVEPDDVPDQHIGDLTAMFDEVNSLPADDPLRQPENTAAMAANVQADRLAEQQIAASQLANPHGGVGTLPDKLLTAFREKGDPNTTMQTTAEGDYLQMKPPVVQPQVVDRGSGAVMVDGGKRVSVPDFKGASLREVVEQSGRLGLRVQMLGSGLAQEQAPASGTMVPLGTEIVVRFAR